MTNREMTAHEARQSWAALVAGAEHRGETTVITRYGKPVAVVGPIDLIHQEAPMYAEPKTGFEGDDDHTFWNEVAALLKTCPVGGLEEETVLEEARRRSPEIAAAMGAVTDVTNRHARENSDRPFDVTVLFYETPEQRAELVEAIEERDRVFHAVVARKARA